MDAVRATSLALGALQSGVAIGAVGAGFALSVEPSGSWIGMPVSLLDGTPFADFRIPGLVLFFVNGVLGFVGAGLSFARSPWAPAAGLALGAFLAAWIVIQVSLIGFLMFLQPLLFAVGLAEMGLALSWGRRTVGASHRRGARGAP